MSDAAMGTLLSVLCLMTAWIALRGWARGC